MAAGRLADAETALYMAAGRLADAETALRQQLSVMEKIPGADRLVLAGLCSSLGFLSNQEQKAGQAAEFFERELAIERQAYKHNSALLYHVLWCLANTYVGSQQFSKADYLYHEWLKVRQPPVGHDQKHSAAAFYGDLARLYLQLERYPECEMFCKKMALFFAQADGPNSLEVGVSHCLLGDIFAHQRKFACAKREYDQAMHIFRKAPVGSLPGIVTILGQSADLFNSLNQLEESNKLRAMADKFRVWQKVK